MKEGINPHEIEALLESVSQEIQHQLAPLYNPRIHGERQAIVVIRTLFYHHFPYLHALVEDENNIQKLVTLFKDCQLFQSLYQQFTNLEGFDSKIIALLINGQTSKLYENLTPKKKQILNVVIAVFYTRKSAELNTLNPLNSDTHSPLFNAITLSFEENTLISTLSDFCNQHQDIDNKNEKLELLSCIAAEMPRRLRSAFLKPLTPSALSLMKYLIKVVNYNKYAQTLHALPRHEVMDDTLGSIRFHANFTDVTSHTKQEIYRAIALYYFPYLKQTHPRKLEKEARTLFLKAFDKHRNIERIYKKLNIVHYQPQVLSNQQILLGLSGNFTLIEQEQIDKEHKKYLYILAAANGHFVSFDHLSKVYFETALGVACQMGKLSNIKKIIEWTEVSYKLSFKKKLKSRWIKHGLKCTAKAGRLNIMKWLLKKYYSKIDRECVGNAFHAAVAYQQHDIVNFILNDYSKDISFYAMGKAIIRCARNGELELLRLLHDRWPYIKDFETNKNFYLASASRDAKNNGHPQVADWIKKQIDENLFKKESKKNKKGKEKEKVKLSASKNLIKQHFTPLSEIRYILSRILEVIDSTLWDWNILAGHLSSHTAEKKLQDILFNYHDSSSEKIRQKIIYYNNTNSRHKITSNEWLGLYLKTLQKSTAFHFPSVAKENFYNSLVAMAGKLSSKLTAKKPLKKTNRSMYKAFLKFLNDLKAEGNGQYAYIIQDTFYIAHRTNQQANKDLHHVAFMICPSLLDFIHFPNPLTNSFNLADDYYFFIKVIESCLLSQKPIFIKTSVKNKMPFTKQKDDPRKYLSSIRKELHKAINENYLQPVCLREASLTPVPTWCSHDYRESSDNEDDGSYSSDHNDHSYSSDDEEDILSIGIARLSFNSK